MRTRNLLVLQVFLTSSFFALISSIVPPSKSTYIVQVSKAQKPVQFVDHPHWYQESLRSVSASPEVLYTYETVLHGFAARLTEEQADALATFEGVVSIQPDVLYELHTTHSPEFLGLQAVDSLLESPDVGNSSDVIVGVLDTGVWPKLKSYADDGLSPVPSTWKGRCEEAKGFPATTCNRKLIGARFFCKGYESIMGPIDTSKVSRSPLDEDGHGTHTSTTIAGSAVPNVSMFGYAPGTARGMALHARLAMYKVCWSGRCLSSDILAAMDKAVEDGVNVISLSLGGRAKEYHRDIIAIGAFGAMEKGVLVTSSAGNDGPGRNSLANVAPWILTVGAGTIDRSFPTYVFLGNGKNYTGVSLSSDKPLDHTKMLQLVYAGNVSNSSDGNFCLRGTLIPHKVVGKIVLCDRGLMSELMKGYVVKQAGGVGMILANTIQNGEDVDVIPHLLPAANVGHKVGEEIRSYITSDNAPTATIVSGVTKLGVKPAPVVAAFSSRGPNGITPGILKPDVIAPGVDILAGWSGNASPTDMRMDHRRTDFNIISGTSMACPHVAGLAALLKSAHPEWSPAALRSALMTTAYVSNHTGGRIVDMATGMPATPFDMGAGHVDPIRALDPGLVYDASAVDYLNFLCALNYTSVMINAVTRKNYNCDPKKTYTVGDHNYPSFVVIFATAADDETGYSSSNSKGKTTTIKHMRTLTNVGTPGTYKASTSFPSSGIEVKVDPTVLNFTKRGEKLSFTVSFTAASQPPTIPVYGSLKWEDGSSHVVASPIVIMWKKSLHI